jgi:hypothetical protein
LPYPPAVPDGVWTQQERDAVLLDQLERRRHAHDQAQWQAPALTIAGQAFLLQVLADEGLDCVARGSCLRPGFWRPSPPSSRSFCCADVKRSTAGGSSASPSGSGSLTPTLRNPGRSSSSGCGQPHSRRSSSPTSPCTSRLSEPLQASPRTPVDQVGVAVVEVGGRRRKASLRTPSEHRCRHRRPCRVGPASAFRFPERNRSRQPPLVDRARSFGTYRP